MSGSRNVIKNMVGIPNVARANELLVTTDWTQLPDSNLTDDCVADFKVYREKLRVIRRTNPSNPTFPTEPTEEWK